jgi:hypothetical protein
MLSIIFIVVALAVVASLMIPTNDKTATSCQRTNVGSLLGGLAIVVVGIVLLLGQFGILDAANLWHFWPVFFIITGIAKITSSNYNSPRVWGGFLILLGIILTLHEFGRFPYGLSHLWPLFIIVGGLLLMWQAYEAKHDDAGYSGEDAVHVISVFGGSEQHINSQKFRGGQLLAVFGGYQLDLSHADIEGEQAVIDATSIFGGGEITIPRHWNVLVRGIGIFGGYGDETGKLPVDANKPPKTLVVKGVAMFGGVAVKN